MFAKILVPTDFSVCADAALDRAIQVAKLAGGEVHLLHVYEIPTLAGEASIALPQEILDQLRENAKQGIAERISKLAAAGVTASGHVVCDSPLRAILDTVAKEHVDLIVMGTHGRTGLKHVLFGSIAERTVRLAACPVMTVKPSYPERETVH